MAWRRFGVESKAVFMSPKGMVRIDCAVSRSQPGTGFYFDPELETFFDGDHALAPAHDAGKGKDKAPPPPPPTEGASTSAHPLFTRLGFTPGAKLPARFTTGDHRTARTHIDAMAAELAKMGDKLAWVQSDLTEAADSLSDVNSDVTAAHITGRLPARDVCLLLPLPPVAARSSKETARYVAAASRSPAVMSCRARPLGWATRRNLSCVAGRRGLSAER
ncbi:hypothetical protein B0H17DRAFT_1141290 [Mycena rosella]|uniref:Uncharacterized protein n=1 Tax=Mycena rosella TaxID=1033263 RepID=A0AAD7D0G1_MYCRO|nr:hypothetical protein B0H17DRAFT_1141290 [Mycena rosella]